MEHTCSKVMHQDSVTRRFLTSKIRRAAFSASVSFRARMGTPLSLFMYLLTKTMFSASSSMSSMPGLDLDSIATAGKGTRFILLCSVY